MLTENYIKTEKVAQHGLYHLVFMSFAGNAGDQCVDAINFRVAELLHLREDRSQLARIRII